MNTKPQVRTPNGSLELRCSVEERKDVMYLCIYLFIFTYSINAAATIADYTHSVKW